MIGIRLKMAREAKKLSMQGLADLVGLSANMIKKYEHNTSMPSSDVLLRLMDVLGVEMDFLFRPVQVELGEVEYRTKSSTPKKLLKQITVDVTKQAERWLTLKELWLDFPVKPYCLEANLPTVHLLDDIEQFADALREYWQLGTNPIPKMIDLLEDLGIIVIVSDVHTDNKFDGLQAVINNTPIIVVSSSWSGDRQRFTLAHELGHLVLPAYLSHDLPDDWDIEKACNRFAGAFLLPKSRMIHEFGEKRQKIYAKELAYLKREYGLSMRAIAYRAKDLGIITATYHKGINIIFNQKGWHKQEPEVYASENTHTFKQLVYRAVAEQIISESKGAELLGMPIYQFIQEQTLSNGTNDATDAD